MISPEKLSELKKAGEAAKHEIDEVNKSEYFEPYSLAQSMKIIRAFQKKIGVKDFLSLLLMIEAQGEMLKIAEEALENTHDHVVDHYNKNKCFHCRNAIYECVTTIQSIRKMRENLK